MQTQTLQVNEFELDQHYLDDTVILEGSMLGDEGLNHDEIQEETLE